MCSIILIFVGIRLVRPISQHATITYRLILRLDCTAHVEANGPNRKPKSTYAFILTIEFRSPFRLYAKPRATFTADSPIFFFYLFIYLFIFIILYFFGGEGYLFIYDISYLVLSLVTISMVYIYILFFHYDVKRSKSIIALIPFLFFTLFDNRKNSNRTINRKWLKASRNSTGMYFSFFFLVMLLKRYFYNRKSFIYALN